VCLTADQQHLSLMLQM